MIRTFIVEIDDSLRGAEEDIDELERKWGAEEVKTWHWIYHEEKRFISAEHWECSWCHRTTMIYPFRVDGNDYDAMYYCPKCGAKMIEKENKYDEP